MRYAKRAMILKSTEMISKFKKGLVTAWDISQEVYDVALQLGCVCKRQIARGILFNERQSTSVAPGRYTASITEKPTWISGAPCAVPSGPTRRTSKNHREVRPVDKGSKKNNYRPKWIGKPRYTLRIRNMASQPVSVEHIHLMLLWVK